MTPSLNCVLGLLSLSIIDLQSEMKSHVYKNIALRVAQNPPQSSLMSLTVPLTKDMQAYVKNVLGKVL